MKKTWKHWLAGALCLTLALSSVTSALADEVSELPDVVEGEEQASPMSITVGEYTPTMRGSENIRGGECYTLIALPLTWCRTQGDRDVSTLTPEELLASTGEALFMGSAVASADGTVTFQDVRLRTADAAVYYITGPGLDKPLYEATSLSTEVYGTVLTDSLDNSASITLVDSETLYHYGNSALADASGEFEFTNLAPGSYTARITKPGYLPYTQQLNVVDARYTDLRFNLSSSNDGAYNAAHYMVGDVDNDGARNMADLAALLRYYGLSQEVPQGITADLNGDGNVDDKDVKLLITAAGMPTPKHITTGTAENVTDAVITMKDSGATSSATLRNLSVGVETTATVSALALSVTYHVDAIQPLNAKGGLVSPVDGSAVANCLVPASGVAARMIGWQVAGETVTLHVVLTCDTPKAAGELAKFYYRPVLGTTESLYDGALTLDRAVAVVGKDTVVEGGTLTYPSQESVVITSVTIDQQPAAGSAAPSLTIPGVGRTAALPLSVTGRGAQGEQRELLGVTWSVSRPDGESPVGISVERGVLTITSEAVAGSVEVTANWEDLSSPPLTVELKNGASVATTIQILKDGAAVTEDRVYGSDVYTWYPEYAAKVYDQYGVALSDQPEITWSLVGAPSWLTVENGIVFYSREVNPSGTWVFTVVAEAMGLQATLRLELELAQDVFGSSIGHLEISGPLYVAIPDEREEPISYHYTVFARDSDGRLRDLSDEDVTLGPSYDGTPLEEEFTREMDGTFTVTVPRSGPSIVFIYEAEWRDAYGYSIATSPLSFYKHFRKEGSDAAQTAIFYEGEAVKSLYLTAMAGEETTFQFEAKHLDRDGALAQDQLDSEEWLWVNFTIDDMAYIYLKDGGLTIDPEAKPGIYGFNVSVEDPEQREYDNRSRLAYSLPITLELLPKLSQLKLATPEQLTLPTAEELQYLLVAEARDAGGDVMELPDDLTWTVTAKGDTKAPNGVSVENGVLHITPAAVPGAITITVSNADGTITDSTDIVLAPGGTETSALMLYRKITVDGKVVQELEPVTVQGDTLDVREDQGVEIAYTAMLVNQTTGVATAIKADQVKWLGGQDIFLVDTATESGVYTQNLTAVYGTQAVSASATVNVYPNITALTLDFGSGKDAAPYEFIVPNRQSKSYTATVMATLKRGGQTKTMPLKELELQNYDLSMATALTGLYATVDKEAGTMTFTIDPTALNNPTSAPTDGDYDVRFVRLLLDYFPDKQDYFDLDFFLVPDTTKVTQALMRRGVGQGLSFAFDSPKTDSVTTAQGTLSNCYAMELLDQYNVPVADETVTWELTVPNALMRGNERLVSIVDPGERVTESYPRYASVRRLRVSPDAPVGGPYELTLTAKAAGLSCTRTIALNVVESTAQTDLTLEVVGDDMIIIPMYYARYNDTVLNYSTNVGSYVAVLHTGENGQYEADNDLYTVAWAVTDPAGAVPAGVSIQGSGVASTVQVDRNAQPTGMEKENLLAVTASVALVDGQEVIASTPLELSRAASVPTLMRIQRDGATVTQERVSLRSDDTSEARNYTFTLFDQYNRVIDDKQVKSQVKWTITSSTGNVVGLQVLPDEQSGGNSARVTVTNRGSSVNRTVYLKASVNVAEPTAPGGVQEVSFQLPITISIAGVGGGGNLGGGGGGDAAGETTTPGVPATISISGNTTVSATQGTAASRTYTAILRDKNGTQCALSDLNKVTWSATGTSGGLTFNSTTHVLTVPANALVGTYTVKITARYSAAVTSTINVTVTVAAQGEQEAEQNTTATTPTVVPVVTQTGTAGTATLTTEQENALTSSTATGGTVTVAPSGGSGLTSISVNLTAATVNALANQKNQSLKVQTTLGTVTLPPAALRGLTGQGGSTVTVKLSSAGGVIQADFVCGSTATALPASVALNAPTSGNLAVKVNTDSTETILKKAVVQNGRVLVYLNGSTQLKVESRTPTFADTEGHWAQEAITFTAARELFQGTSATTFAPNDTMTRSMVVTVLHRLEDTPAATATVHFADVEQGSWYTNAVDWANAQGIVQGTDQGFKPGDPVTREQLATILYRYASAMGLSTSQRTSLSAFSDRGKVSSWAQDAMQWAVGVGLINGKTGGVLDPTGNATRAEVSTILQRLIVYMAPSV